METVKFIFFIIGLGEPSWFPYGVGDDAIQGAKSALLGRLMIFEVVAYLDLTSHVVNDQAHVGPGHTCSLYI